MKLKRIAAMTIVIAMIGSTALAHSYQQGDIRVGHIWARATPSGTTATAVYFPLLNTGKSPDRFISASSPIAEKVEIHDETKDKGIMKMEELDGVTLEPNVPVSFRPGGKHLMAMGLKRPIKEGEMLPLTLQFEKAGSIKVDAMVESAGAMSGEHH